MRKAILSFSLFVCLVNICFAQSNEFTPLEAPLEQRDKLRPLMDFIQIAGSKYFNIYSSKEADLLKLIRRLDIRSGYLLMSVASSTQEQQQGMLADIVDAIFLEACDVLHMYLYSFKGNIKICQNQKELNEVFRKFSERDLDMHSFYVHNTNSIYINMGNIRPEYLAREIAHAIIAHYFVVLPPAEVRETLAKDVGYQIKKLAK